MKICWQFSLFDGLAEPHQDWTKATLIQHHLATKYACLPQERTRVLSLVLMFS